MKPPAPARAHHRHLFLAGLGSALLVTLLCWSFATVSTARQWQQQVSDKIRQSEQAQRQKRSDRADITRLQPVYQQLQTLAQPTSTAARAKRLLALQDKLQLPGLRYQFQPRQILPAADGIQQHFVSQTLHLHLDLLHEEDLLHFLEQLTQTSDALLITRDCQLGRSAAAALSADCQIDWFSLASPT